MGNCALALEYSVEFGELPPWAEVAHRGYGDSYGYGDGSGYGYG